MIKNLPNLEMIGVYNCGLVHIGSVTLILDVIAEVTAGTNRHIDLDIAPRRHRGPYRTQDREGEFGITWQAIGLTAQIGLGKILLESHLKAKALDIDLFSRGRAFRHWLENIPLPPKWVAQTLDAIMNMADWAPRGLDRMQHRTLASDLCAAITQGIGRHYIWMKPELWIWSGWCSKCRYSMPIYFFDAGQRSRLASQRVCEGCQLTYACDREVDHMKRGRSAAVCRLFPDLEPCDIWHRSNQHEIQLPENPFLVLDNGPNFPADFAWGNINRGTARGLPTLGQLVHENYETNWFDAGFELQMTDLKCRRHLFLYNEHYDNKDPDHMQKETRSNAKQWTWASILEKARRDRIYQAHVQEALAIGVDAVTGAVHENVWYGWPREYMIPVEENGHELLI